MVSVHKKEEGKEEEHSEPAYKPANTATIFVGRPEQNSLQNQTVCSVFILVLCQLCYTDYTRERERKKVLDSNSYWICKIVHHEPTKYGFKKAQFLFGY